jgi:hypothetical protein
MRRPTGAEAKGVPGPTPRPPNHHHHRPPNSVPVRDRLLSFGLPGRPGQPRPDARMLLPGNERRVDQWWRSCARSGEWLSRGDGTALIQRSDRVETPGAQDSGACRTWRQRPASVLRGWPRPLTSWPGRSWRQGPEFVGQGRSRCRMRSIARSSAHGDEEAFAQRCDPTNRVWLRACGELDRGR